VLVYTKLFTSNVGNHQPVHAQRGAWSPVLSCIAQISLCRLYKSRASTGGFLSDTMLYKLVDYLVWHMPFSVNYCRPTNCIADASERIVPEWTGIECKKGYGWFEDEGQTFVNSSYLNNASYMGRNDWENGTYINGSCQEFATAAQQYFS